MGSTSIYPLDGMMVDALATLPHKNQCFMCRTSQTTCLTLPDRPKTVPGIGKTPDCTHCQHLPNYDSNNSFNSNDNNNYKHKIGCTCFNNSNKNINNRNHNNNNYNNNNSNSDHSGNSSNNSRIFNSSSVNFPSNSVNIVANNNNNNNNNIDNNNSNSKSCYLKSKTSRKHKKNMLFNLLSHVKEKTLNKLCLGILVQLMFSVLLLNLTFSQISLINGEEITIPQGNSRAETGVCQSIDVRNKPENLKKLENCTVVEGFVQILLIDRYTDSAYDNYSFPNLVEITDYLLLFRVNGLKSLRTLFPNLSVIRGQKLIENYALVIYELMHIQEVGLISLTNIGRGAVRIEKNPSLCHVNTIDWTRIAKHTSDTDHYIISNKADNSCPLCNNQTTLTIPHENSSFVYACPEAKNSNPHDKNYLCWTSTNCQRQCPVECENKACNIKGKCCADNCLSCDDHNPSICIVCKDLSIGIGENKKCIEKCPSNHFKHMGRRCITKDACHKILKPVDLSGEDRYPYIAFNGNCTLTCPENHYEYVDQNKNSKSCKKCAGPCRKECSGASIESIQSAQELRGCTIIKGSLLIQIRSQGGLNIVKELEQSLSLIEEIEGQLKIVRSFPLLSLSFFKNLKVIHGMRSDDGFRSLQVMDNQNLQDLFDHEVKISSGTLSFHYNPKLCFDKIEKLKNDTKLKIENEEQAKSTNGDRTACDVSPLEVNVTKILSEVVILRWKPLQLDDLRKLLGYVVYYIKAPYQNVTLFDGRDACGGDGWSVEDVKDYGPDKEPITHILTHLEPYTQYAFYVKTYTIASEKTGAQSNITYFRTAPGQPTKVRIKADQITTNSIKIKWDPPIKANGKLSLYRIVATLNKENTKQLDERDYCSEPVKKGEVTIPKTAHHPEPTSSPSKDTCDCVRDCKSESKSSLGLPTDTSEAESQINFEDRLHNWVYIKNPKKETNRRKRDLLNFNDTVATDIKEFPNNNSSEITQGQPLQGTIDPFSSIIADTGNFYEQFFDEVNATIREFNIPKLKHYSMYTIKVTACRELAESEAGLVIDDKENNCSTAAILTINTHELKGVDNINSSSFFAILDTLNGSQTGVRLKWEEPKNPNGLIVSYSIKFKRLDLDSAKSEPICITRKKYLNNSGYHVITDLNPGNYSFQVAANSLFGEGEYTKEKYVTIAPKDVSSAVLWIVLCACLLVLSILGGIGYFWYTRRYLPSIIQMKLIASVNPDYAGVVYKVDEWEISRDNIIQKAELGQGSFGMVYEGIVKHLRGTHGDIMCAIKTVNENATDRERASFLQEASVMKQFSSNHVVRLLGVVSQSQPTLVIMELMALGDLKKYLRSHRPDYENGLQPSPQPPTLKRILNMAVEIADGMAYLSAKKFVHRDLAARNCMVAADLTVKIGDFGMTRDIYETDYYRKGTKGFLPVRWMSPESLKDGVFTSSSDVFSYGVVLWEMATLASQPYQGLTNDQVLRYVIDGGVMERPENCPDELYDLMRNCWQHRPSARPTFLEIITRLLPHANDHFSQVSYYHSPEGQDMLAQSLHVTTITDDVTVPLRQHEDEDEPMSSIDVDGVHEHDDEPWISVEQTNSQLVPDNGPLPIMRSAHSPLSPSNGTPGINCDSLAISYHSRNDNKPSVNGLTSSSNSFTTQPSFLGRSVNENRYTMFPPQSSLINEFDKVILAGNRNRKNGRINSETTNQSELRPLRNGFVVNLQ